MKLSEFKSHLNQMETVQFVLPNGSLIPPHFHITEVGQIEKRFIDCGGVLRKESESISNYLLQMIMTIV